MPRIGLISDTHGYLDPRVVAHFAACDEIWHAGDFGSIDVAQQLQEITTVRGVFGNIDEEAIRQRFPLHQRFTCDQLDVWMTHIGGRPGAMTAASHGNFAKRRQGCSSAGIHTSSSPIAIISTAACCI